MALVKCLECAISVSDKAQSCPSCGVPIATVGANNVVQTTRSFTEWMDGYSLNKEIVCAQCGKKGCVLTKRVKAKKGISGAKATGALITGGLSIFVTGLSRKEWVTEAKCKNCKSEWQF